MASLLLKTRPSSTTSNLSVSSSNLIRNLLTWKGVSFLTHQKRGPAKLRTLDFAEKNGYVKGMIAEMLHDPAREAQLCRVKFRYPFRSEEFFVAVEGVREGHPIYCGKKAPIAPGNVLPLSSIPIGTAISCVEHRAGDGGRFCRAAGCQAVVLSHNFKEQITRVRLRSKSEKVLASNCRAVIGKVAGGGPRKPLGKAGRAFHIYKSKGKKYPTVRGLAKNPVDHPHGGGSHGHIRTVSRTAPPGRKVGYIAARRTGRPK
eukprot:TRINITY_DN40408_c0_g1_i1.p1 TRINITY_DN40408_c0_g1~~TRINITY_DN40408_c0_g1_i1.p1  ORF type:complete len:259 (-),score=26.44 TRINITY_DN40408_c0_g1_i1:204-980(-)